jgi:hypothetical protein
MLYNAVPSLHWLKCENSASKHFVIRMVAEPSVRRLRGCESYPPFTAGPQPWRRI